MYDSHILYVINGINEMIITLKFYNQVFELREYNDETIHIKRHAGGGEESHSLSILNTLIRRLPGILEPV